MEHLKPLAQWLIALPKGAGEVLIVVVSVVASLLFTWLYVELLEPPSVLLFHSLVIAFFVPLVVASPVSAVLLYLLRQLDTARQTAHALAHTDALTGCANRRRWMDVALRQWQRHQAGEQALSMVLVDLDNFKRINDQFGHDAGDAVLCAAAQAIERTLRPGDLMARWGGEEFVALLPGAPVPHATEAAERVRQAIEIAPAPAISGGATRPPVTASIGVATLRPGESLDSLINRADAAMYAAKRKGKNCCVQAQ